VGTLYVVRAPAYLPGSAGRPESTGGLGDLTQRALQVLRGAALVVGDDDASIKRLCTQLDLPLSPLADRVGAALEALEHGDVVFLASGWFLGLSEVGGQLVHMAIERGIAVVPAPGPVLPLTALVLSGLPAHSFVWIGELPQQSTRHSLLPSLIHDSRTTIALVSGSRLVEGSAQLHASLGNRPLAIVISSELGEEVVWRGMLDEVAGSSVAQRISDRCVLVIGGSEETHQRWDEDRLRARVETLRAGGLGAREISRKLAEESAWPRREIYKMVVEAGQPDIHHMEEL
jgi:16S rRNA (cytidine1402-2'-O)-methyltransferase